MRGAACWWVQKFLEFSGILDGFWMKNWKLRLDWTNVDRAVKSTKIYNGGNKQSIKKMPPTTNKTYYPKCYPIIKSPEVSLSISLPLLPSYL